ncbi:MAG TPA: hypothetical protein VHB79_19580 [Polyangiaceae bacterium]|nr:hypothetical protein [Polyangiaceae bacterium]
MSLLAGALAVAQSGPALAEQPRSAATKQSDAADPDVTELMRTALARYKQNDLEGAREAFQKAWDLRQHAAIAASLADVELKLGRYREAAGHLNFYLAHLPPGKETMRADAEQQLAECKKHLGTINVKVEPADAMVLVDGSAISEGPQEVLVEPGAHALQAAASGRVSPKESFSIAAGERREAQLVVAPASAAPVPQGPATTQTLSKHPPLQQQPAEEGSSTQLWVAVGGGAATAVGVAIGIAFTLKSNTASSHADELLRQIQSKSDPKLVATGGECTANPAPAQCADYSQARSDTKQARNIAIGSFIGGGVFALATVGALVFWPENKHAPVSARLTLSPTGNWRAPGLVLQGTF